MRDANDDQIAQFVREYFQLADQFHADPSIENYVALRRRSRGDVEVGRLGGVDPLFTLRQELEQHGIDPYVVCGAQDGDVEDMDELSLQIMECMIERRGLNRSGNTHVQSRGEAISDGLIDYLIVAMLAGAETYNVSLPSSLLLLIRERLGGANPTRHKHYEMTKRRNDAALLGSFLLRLGEEPSVCRVAELMGVEPSTVSRWFRGDFRDETEQWHRNLNAFGT